MGLKKLLIDEAAKVRQQLPDTVKGKAVDEVLLALLFETGHLHLHYPDNHEFVSRVYRDIGKEKGFENGGKINIDKLAQALAGRLAERGSRRESIQLAPLAIPAPRPNRKIIFRHHRAAGDSLMFSAGVRDFKLLFPDFKIGIEDGEKWIWENNPYIDTLNKKDEDVEFYRVGYPMVGNVNNTAMHFTTMFLFDMIAVADLHDQLPLKLGEFCAAFANGTVGDPSLGNPEKNAAAKEPFITLREKYKEICKNFVRQRGDIHLSEQEKDYNMVKETFGAEKYWVIAPGGKRDVTTKIWDWRRFQDVIDHFKGRIKFVVIGKSDLLVEKLDGVIDLVDKFNKDIRQLVPLVYHAEGCVSGPSLLMHLTAALPPRFKSERKPCVSILGGREPSAWTWYCNHQVLHTNGVFSCCDNGGCWKARTFPLPKDPKHNKNLCQRTVESNGRTVQACMDSIRSEDVIRAMERYYEGDIYQYAEVAHSVERRAPSPEVGVRSRPSAPTPVSPDKVILCDEVDEIAIKNIKARLESEKQINILGNLNSAGGGEQSMLMIAEILLGEGWQVNLHPWGSVHSDYSNRDLKCNFEGDWGETMAKEMIPNLPLLFYANDCIDGFLRHGQKIVEKSSKVIIGINYTIGGFKDMQASSWLAKSGKFEKVVFQNEEKRDEWRRQVIGFEHTETEVLFGAIDIDKFYEVCPAERKDKKMVVAKHCVADYRKYVTERSKGKGDKIHVWQKNLDKELDTKFYGRLLKDTKDIYFRFMKAPDELQKEFENEERMEFFDWNEVSVSEFLGGSHIYLYRTSNLWRDQYPRVVAEALAAGLPVLTEPRDGTKDRVEYGDTGFYCVDYDGFLYHLKLLQRKDKYRLAMGQNAKDWAKKNLDPRKWLEVVK